MRFSLLAALPVVLVSLGVSGPCQAERPSIETPGVPSFENGNKLLPNCQAPSGTPYHTYCLGFAAAVADEMMSANANGETFLGYRSCIPMSALLDQVTDVATRFLITHPEKRHLTALSIFAQAFEEAFPCPSASR
jgi:hypothetical protein